MTPNYPRRRRTPLLIIGLIALLLGAGLWYFFGGNAPSAVDLESAAAAVTSSTGVDSPVASTADTAAGTAVEGTWTVDTTVGEFSVTEDTAATFAGFRVNEVLDAVGETVAVGRTPNVAGTLQIDGTTLDSANITVDLTTLVSDRARREGAIQRALNTSANPEATFTLAEPIDLGTEAESGDTVTATATGDLTINGVTKTVTVPIEAKLVDGLIIVTGSVDVIFADYNVNTPSAPIVLSLEDQGIMEFQLWFSR
jgi:polyisoprenoid-binding protein YceI